MGDVCPDQGHSLLSELFSLPENTSGWDLGETVMQEELTCKVPTP